MSRRADYEIVVGVDGSKSSLDAVAWAAREAADRGGAVRIVHAWMWPLMHVPLGPASGVAEGGFTFEANRLLQDARAVASATAADVPVETDLQTGAPNVVLARASRDSDLLVLGSRGLGGFTGMLLGSVAVAMARRSACPLVIVRGHSRPSGAVVVGVDGSSTDDVVLAAAFSAAERAGAPLIAIHVWQIPPALTPPSPWWGKDVDAIETVAEHLLDQALEPWLERYPGVTVEKRVLPGSPTGALVDASRGARLVVVGSHGAGSLRDLIVGGVCHGVIYHAECPVRVERPAGRTDEATAPPSS